MTNVGSTMYLSKLNRNLPTSLLIILQYDPSILPKIGLPTFTQPRRNWADANRQRIPLSDVWAGMDSCRRSLECAK
jgi:hypothetical protein